MNEKERELFGKARLFLKEARMKRECGVIVEGGRAIYIGPDASDEERKNVIVDHVPAVG